MRSSSDRAWREERKGPEPSPQASWRVNVRQERRNPGKGFTGGDRLATAKRASLKSKERNSKILELDQISV